MWAYITIRLYACSLHACRICFTGDGKATILSKTGALQQMRKLEKKGKSLMQLRKIRQFDEDFDLEEFAQQAHTIYEEAHLALANGDKKKLGNLVRF